MNGKIHTFLYPPFVHLFNVTIILLSSIIFMEVSKVKLTKPGTEKVSLVMLFYRVNKKVFYVILPV